jgi:exosortase A-associated hydrolase 2
MQARAFAALGYRTLCIDFSCTGDSEGEFVDASWENWVSDVEAAARWLASQGARRFIVWGLRLGALVALEWLQKTAQPVTRALLWQPVTSGRQFLRQLLRIRTVADTVAGQTQTTVNQLLEDLRAGRVLEVAGYALSPRLAAQIDAADSSRAWAPRTPDVSWFEVVQEAGQDPPLGSEKSAAEASRHGVRVSRRVVVDQAFWRSVEIVAARALVDATTVELAPP